MSNTMSLNTVVKSILSLVDHSTFSFDFKDVSIKDALETSNLMPKVTIILNDNSNAVLSVMDGYVTIHHINVTCTALLGKELKGLDYKSVRISFKPGLPVAQKYSILSNVYSCGFPEDVLVNQ